MSPRVGISLTSLHVVQDPREGPRHMVERARAAREAGLDSLFVGDHHATPLPYYQNTPILGRLLAEWSDAPAGALYLLPLWHPVILAEQIGTLAAIARGRFVLQCALGPDDVQFPALGISARERRSRFEQCLDVVRRLLAGEVVEHSGHWELSGARVSPVPAEPVEVWIGASAPPAIDRAARLGDGWLGSPHLDVARARGQLAAYRERCAAHDREVGTCAIRRDFYLAADDADAKETREATQARGYRGFPDEALLIGTASELSDRLAALGELGYDDVILRSLVPEPERVLASIERLADLER